MNIFLTRITQKTRKLNLTYYVDIESRKAHLLCSCLPSGMLSLGIADSCEPSAMQPSRLSRDSREKKRMNILREII